MSLKKQYLNVRQPLADGKLDLLNFPLHSTTSAAGNITVYVLQYLCLTDRPRI
jgi:hypothetical protein